MKFLDGTGLAKLVALIKALVSTKQNKATSDIVMLTVAGWVDNEQTVNVGSVTPNNTVFVSAQPSSAKAWSENFVICTEQGDEALTFTCETVPTEDIGVGVVCL